MTNYWATSAVLPTGLAHRVRVEVADGRITRVTSKAPPAAEDVQLDGIMLPGFANAHSHAFHRALRGRTHASGNFWTWRDQMYTVARVLDPDTYFGLARAVFAEMVSAGFTVVGEFHYLHHGPNGQPYDDPNAMGHAVVAAAAEAGIRLTLLDTCYLSGGLAGSGHLDLDPVQQRFSDGHVADWIGRVGRLADGPTTRIGAGVHSVRAVPRDALRDLASIVGNRPVHAHVSEQLAENAAATLYYGCTPTRVFEEAGLVGPGFTAVHATHADTDDIHRLAHGGAAVCLCPTTERDLADGIGPARALSEAGVPLCLGTDQHAMIDPFEEVRGLEMHERLLTGERGRFTLEELAAAAGPVGYSRLGWPDGGAIAAGQLADLVVVQRDSPRTAGSRPNQILFSATSADVLATIVAGELIVTDGKHRLGDVGRLLAEAFEAVRR
ncbi:MAG: formimidoylglutamate deiminase [Tetrasphaera sp.]